MISEFIIWCVELVASFGYLGIVVLMAMESSIFPVPSELVMIPAGYHASTGEMNLFLVILAGTFGSLLGALVNYYVALKLGRRVLLIYGKYFFFSRHTLRKVDRYFFKHGHISTFTGRLIPVVRHFISIPAGLSRMNLAVFIFYTTLGSLIWMVTLALLGYFIGENMELIKPHLTLIMTIIFASIALLIVLYIWKIKKNG